MSSTSAPAGSSYSEEMSVSGEHLQAVEAQKAAITSPASRRRWYGVGTALAVVGTAASVATHRQAVIAPTFVAGLAALPVILGGFGPFLLAAWGTLLVTLAIEGPSLAPSFPEQVRLASGLVMALVAAVFSEVIRRNRIESIDREFRLAQALRRSEALRREREEADARRRLESDRAAAELRARDQQIARISSTVPGVLYQLLWYRDATTRFLFASARAADLFGIDPADVIVDANLAWARVLPEDVPGVVATANEAAERLAPWRCEFRITDHTNGHRWRWVLGSAICQSGPSADCVLFTGLFTDITEQRHFEENLRQTQRIESIGRLAGGVAHDFNNVLTAITGEASLLESEVPPGGPVSLGLQRIRAAADSGAALSRQLLGFARRQVMSPRLVDVHLMIERATPLVRRLLRESIRLEVDVADDVGVVRVDPGLFDQVLLNLATNARDAMPGGGVLRVQVRRLPAGAPARADDGAIAPGPLVEVTVADTGVGMPDAVRARVFEPFFTTKPVGEGSGLGLSTSFGIVSQAGGLMTIASREGEGTTVRIVLPWIDPAEAAPLRSSDPPRHGTERLLVVDDDDQVRRVTAATLRRCGYEVLEASGGREAVKIARESTPPVALVVTDVVMPELSGVEVVQAIRAAGLTPRVLFLSGYPEGTVTQHGIIPDGVDLLEKPYAVRELLRRVRDVLDRDAEVAS